MADQYNLYKSSEIIPDLESGVYCGEIEFEATGDVWQVFQIRTASPFLIQSHRIKVLPESEGDVEYKILNSLSWHSEDKFLGEDDPRTDLIEGPTTVAVGDISQGVDKESVCRSAFLCIRPTDPAKKIVACVEFLGTR